MSETANRTLYTIDYFEKEKQVELIESNYEQLSNYVYEFSTDLYDYIGEIVNEFTSSYKLQPLDFDIDRYDYFSLQNGVLSDDLSEVINSLIEKHKDSKETVQKLKEYLYILEEIVEITNDLSALDSFELIVDNNEIQVDTSFIDYRLSYYLDDCDINERIAFIQENLPSNETKKELDKILIKRMFNFNPDEEIDKQTSEQLDELFEITLEFLSKKLNGLSDFFKEDMLAMSQNAQTYINYVNSYQFIIDYLTSDDYILFSDEGELHF